MSPIGPIARQASTCANNTATEHAMMERLVIDDVMSWVRHYRVDGFRCGKPRPFFF
jgi:pullulanase/glycogen debranching enzyme